MKNKKNISAQAEPEFDFTKITTLEGVCKRMGVVGLPTITNALESLMKPMIDGYIVMLIIACMNNGWLPDFTKGNPKYYLYFWVRSDGSGFSDSYYHYATTGTRAGSRLYIENEEKARHILKYFEKYFENYYLAK